MKVRMVIRVLPDREACVFHHIFIDSCFCPFINVVNTLLQDPTVQFGVSSTVLWAMWRLEDVIKM